MVVCLVMVGGFLVVAETGVGFLFFSVGLIITGGVAVVDLVVGDGVAVDASRMLFVALRGAVLCSVEDIGIDD